jgi:hypothetical protein
VTLPTNGRPPAQRELARIAASRGDSALELCKFLAATGYGGLSRLSVGNAVRRAVVMVDVTRVAAFRAPVVGIFASLMPRMVDPPASARKATGAPLRVADASGSSRGRPAHNPAPEPVAVSTFGGGLRSPKGRREARAATRGL